MAPRLEMFDDRAADGELPVYICDDSPEYRMLLRLVLADAGATIVGEGADGRDAWGRGGDRARRSSCST